MAAWRRRRLWPHRRHERLDTHDVQDPREVIGQHVQCHLGGDLWQRLHQEVGCTHPGLDRSEGMQHRRMIRRPAGCLRIDPAKPKSWWGQMKTRLSGCARNWRTAAPRSRPNCRLRRTRLFTRPSRRELSRRREANEAFKGQFAAISIASAGPVLRSLCPSDDIPRRETPRIATRQEYRRLLPAPRSSGSRSVKRVRV